VARTPLIIDTEASGSGALSYPIDVGGAILDGQQHGLLIHPAADWTHCDAAAGSWHGISRHTMLSFGQPASEVSQLLWYFYLTERMRISDKANITMSSTGQIDKVAERGCATAQVFVNSPLS